MSTRGRALLRRFATAGFWLPVMAFIAALASTLVVHAREFRSGRA